LRGTWGDIDAFIEKASLADEMGQIRSMRGIYKKEKHPSVN
jgi:hypothetical protein